MAMGNNLISFITGVNFTKSTLRTLNALTFAYDPNWHVSQELKTTFPIAFFHVKGQHEIMETEVSQKQMLFYNSQRVVNNNNTTGSILNIVADNVINKPKRYTLDVILPFNGLSLLTSTYLFQPEQMANITNMLAFKDGVSNTVLPYLTGATTGINLIKDVLMSILSNHSPANPLTGTDLLNMARTITSTPDYNKSSLEAMWANRTIIKVKMWNSWAYKYVVITNLDISKEPNEEGVYEASISCQEVPILTLRNDSTQGVRAKIYNNKFDEFVGKKVIKFFDGKESVE